MTPSNPYDELLEEVQHTLAVLARYGAHGFDCSPQGLTTLEKWDQGDDEGAAAQTTKAAKVSAPAGEDLAGIRAQLGECRRCPLSKARRNIVFGVGSPAARLVFVGEGPGFDEDRLGEPFVGAAGKLLTKIIQAMHLTREAVYIANIVKCRPPNNRTPQPEEIQTCYPFLESQLATIQPEVICALGKIAAQTLLATTRPISQLRGQFHSYKGIPVMPTFHPAYLLRNPEKKRAVWEDIQQVMQLLKSGHP